MSRHQIHIFISHAWSHSGHYQTLANWIFGETWSVGQAALDFRDFSVPKDDPIHSAQDSRALEEAIFDQIARSHVIVVPTGMYASYSHWIQKEIDGALSYRKPVLAVTPWAQERESDVVVSNADLRVGWNKGPIVDGVWELFRG